MIAALLQLPVYYHTISEIVITFYSMYTNKKEDRAQKLDILEKLGIGSGLGEQPSLVNPTENIYPNSRKISSP